MQCVSSPESAAASREVLAYPLEVGGLETRVLQWGSGPRDVLFLHGAGARADRWVGTMKRLDPALYRAVAIDFPGHGFATKGDKPEYSTSAFADLATEVIARLGLKRPALVGTSMGGHVAATMVTRDPQVTLGLVLVGAVGLIPIPEELNQLIARGLVATERQYILMKLQTVLCNKALITDDLVEVEWRINNSAGAREGFAKLSRYWLERHRNDLIGPKLAAMSNRPPIRLIWGSDDRTTPLDIGLVAADMLTGGEISALSGAGHAPYLDQPEAFCAALFPFLDQLHWPTDFAKANSASGTEG